MKAFVGVTDKAWADFLAQRPHLAEINFWRPSGGVFKALSPGDLFLFKTHKPHDRIVGGAVFSGFALVPLSEAWAAFHEGNGRSDLSEVREAISRYRMKNSGSPILPGEDPAIGCVMLRDPVFLPEKETFDPPADFASNLVQGKGYPDITAPEHADYFAPIVTRILGQNPTEALTDDAHAVAATWEHNGPVVGEGRITRRRLGQEAFKLALLDAYEGRCAVTGQRVRPVLEAAHIHPVSEGGLHRLDNGLLLRSDVHRLFDLGYLSVSPDLEVRVSPHLHKDFPDAGEYTALEGRPVSVPGPRADRPSRDALQWHLSEVFRAE
ncbi:HNH endonuclease [Nocardiopsis halotolerans]|uniref:HNH endonuclease n=1 Tax=Nocardiopsis halotolerans TaxID=124252 RepID=UPI000475FCD2|nr:HNH endonuclease [Nocardiopsis halotolerans]